MSYILDALKKADQERQQGDIPDLKSSSVATAQTTSNTRNMLWLLPLAISILVLVWFKPWENRPLEPLSNAPSNNTAPAVVEQSAQPVMTSQKVESDQEVSTTQLEAAPLIKEDIEPRQAEVAMTPEAESETEVSSKGPDNIPNVMNLPPHIRDTLPAIQISGHIYDETPASRMVIINDAVRKEGRYISDGLMLEEITEDGIILNYSGTLFFMRVFDSWPG